MATMEVNVPDIGDFDEVSVIELLVKVGDRVRAEQSLITVESDKASMEIPSSHAGEIKAMSVKLGDKVKKGSVILTLETDVIATAAPSGLAVTEAKQTPVIASEAKQPQTAAPSGLAVTNEVIASEAKQPETAAPSGLAVTDEVIASAAKQSPELPRADGPRNDTGLPHASPSVRKFARELGVPLNEVKGSGPKGRISQEDVQAFSRAVMAGETRTQAQSSKAPAGDGAGLGLIPWPKVDFAKFGPIERKELGRIQKISGANLLRNAVMIPAVTNHDDADITELEAFRVATNKENEKSGVKVTMLAFLIKACVSALQKFPQFNSSLDGDALVYKQYWHIGFAADTPNGLMVPVLKDADKKGILQISAEMGELAKKAREGKLSPAEMSGATFTISSLGGIGGRYFTPIINAPEVAILGVCRSTMEPVWNSKEFEPRLMLPLSLTWDHRVIDGAAAARFNAHLGQILSDFRRVLL
jgi:pyruvate dehydrogenase E2 component (dihydrolipoamide acetyltransferase)